MSDAEISELNRLVSVFRWMRGTLAASQGQAALRLTSDRAALSDADALMVLTGDPGIRLPHLTPMVDGERREALQRYVRTVELPEDVKRSIVELTGSTVVAHAAGTRLQVVADRLDNRCPSRCMRGAYELRN